MNTAEQKIFTAHKQAGQYCLQGSSPTESLIKAARDQDLNPEMLKRAAEMLNISLTKSFLKTAEDKTASFPLADYGVALKEIFTGHAQTKTASLKENLSPATSGLSIKIKPVEQHSFFKKSAAVENKGNLQDVVKEIEGAQQLLKVATSNANQNYLAAEAKAFDSFKSIIGHFCLSEHLPKFAAFEEQCYAEYGQESAGYVQTIADHLPNPKRAEIDYTVKSASVFKPTVESAMFDNLVECSISMREMAKEASDRKAEMEEFNQEVRSHSLVILGVDQKQAGLEGLLNFKKAADIGQMMGIHNPLEAAITAHNTNMGNKYTKGLENEQLTRYKTPSDEASMEVENARRQAILADLMSNDEVIAGQEPHHVESAYNTLLSISPRSTLHREVVRAVLRNATAQQAVDPFTAQQLAGLESTHIKNEQSAKGVPAPH